MPSIADSLEVPFSRFMFNIGLLEQRVRSQPRNGIVMNFATGKYEFDPELCTARSEDELLESVRSLAKHPKFGRSMFSSQAPDPDEKDETKLEQWRELNKQFEELHNDKENQNNVKAKGAQLKKKKPFSEWASNPPSSDSSGLSTTPPASSSNPLLNTEDDLNCLNFSSSQSVVRPVYKKRKLWALEFAESSPMPSSSSSSSFAYAGANKSSSSKGNKMNSFFSQKSLRCGKEF